MKTIFDAMIEAKISAEHQGIKPNFAVLGQVKRKQLHDFFDEHKKAGLTVSIDDPKEYPKDYIEFYGMRVFFSAIPGIVVSATDPRKE